MISLIKTSFKILRNNFIFIQPVLLFLLITLTVMSYTLGANRLSAANIILAVSVFLLFTAFSAGWFYINKLGIINYNENDSREEITVKSVQNFKKFFEGVGLNFINTLFSYILIIILYVLCFYAVSKFLVSAIGIPSFIHDLPKVLNTNSQNELTAFLNGISNHDKLSFSIWVLSLNALTALMNYCAAVYFALLTFERKNIFKTALMSISFIFKNIIPSLFIIIFTELLYFCLNILSAVTGSNIVAFIIIILLFTTYLNYYLLLVFCFYNEKSKVNSNSGAERLG